MSIAFYISGHGFGHAARQGAIIRELAAQKIKVFVRTPTPQKFFNFAGVDYVSNRYDIGLIQPDSLTVDVPATFAWYKNFLKEQPELIAQEVAFIRENKVRLIVSDMPPIAFEIAQTAGILSVACTHFTWDWVYAQYMADFPQFQPIVDSLRESYGKATLALQMPFAHEFDMFSQVEAIPLVTNPLTQSREEIRATFHVPDDYRICLLSMGGMNWGDSDISVLRDMQGWTFLVMPDVWDSVCDLSNFHKIATDYPNYQNLIAAADVLVGKAGWSTVAEVIAHRTPMLYTLRDGYSENVLLEAGLREFGNSLYIEKSAFVSGAWTQALNEIVEREHKWKDIGTNGAQVAAQRLLTMLD